jgi:hypothetical protein
VPDSKCTTGTVNITVNAVNDRADAQCNCKSNSLRRHHVELTAVGSDLDCRRKR